jgi:putative ABC transport system permease protein
MRSIRALLVRLSSLLRSQRRDRELSAELEAHVRMHIDDNLRAGMVLDQARRDALMKLGGVEVTTEKYRDRRGIPVLETVIQDLRYATRMMRKAPGFSVVAVLTLALGIGATTAIFSVVDTVVLQPLAYRNPKQLVVVHEVIPTLSNLTPFTPVNALHFREWRKVSRAFERMSLVGIVNVNLTGAGEPDRLLAGRVSSNLFATLGVEPQLGRSFLEEEDQPGRDRVVVLNDALWRRRFAADPAVIGRTIRLDGEPYEVVGVLPSDFSFPKLSELYDISVVAGQPQLWKPFAATAQELTPLGSFNFVCIGRLRPGVSPDQALVDLNAVQATLGTQLPDKTTLRAALVPLQDQITGRSRRGLELVVTAVSFVLLIGCVNIANLQLVRSAGRHREVAIRTAIGASRGRLVRQLLVESLALSTLGGVLGAAIAYIGIRLIVVYAPADIPRLEEVQVNSHLLVFAFALSLITGVLVGLLPAWRSTTVNPREATTATLRTRTAGQSRGRLRSLLVGAEVAMSVMCLIAAGLLLNSFVKLLNVDPGFEVQRIVSVQLSLPSNRYPNTAKRAEFVRSAIERLQSQPGVVSVGMSNNLPLTGTGANSALAVEGTTLPRMERPAADLRMVNPDYFKTMGIPLRAGRLFGELDRGHLVAIVSSVTADRLWPGENPLGKRFRRGRDDSPFTEVVGVAGAIRTVGLDQSPPLTVYLPYWSVFGSDVSILIRSATDTSVTSAVVKDAIRQIDAELAIPAIRTMEEVVAASVAQRRFQMNLVLLFAGLATLLASLGIYGVVSYSVTQRTSEFGIRLALGARSGQIRRLVFRQGLLPVAVGLGAGVVASTALGQLLGSLLFGVAPTDPLTISGAVGLLGLVAAFAVDLPARRATQVDPLLALRYE